MRMIRTMIRKSAILLLPVFLIMAPFGAVAGEKKGPSKKDVREMIDFGISLAEEGLWKEALYRWREALRHDPDNPKLLNNIAVALESQGDMEGARDTYARAEELAGRARYIERNIEDFEELFTALEQYEVQFRKPPAVPPEAGTAEADTPPPAEQDQTPVASTEAGDSDDSSETPPVEPAADSGAAAAPPDKPPGDQKSEEEE
jgi:tetratricopeptide (TPR) repeat protein